MGLTKKESPSVKAYYKRIEKENAKLHSNTFAFLLANTIVLVAFGISDDVLIRFIISLLGVFITLIWMFYAWQIWRGIRDLTNAFYKTTTPDYLDTILKQALFKPGWLKPTNLVAKLLPFTFLIAWLVLLILHVLKLFRLLVFF
jgi:hypothetical protein